MGDNETSAAVQNEENEDVQSKIPPVTSNFDKIDEEIKQLDENSSHNVGNFSTKSDSSELADTKSGIKSELDQKEQSELESKHEDITSEILSTVSNTNPELNATNISKKEKTTEEKVLEKSETIVPTGSSPNKSDISNSIGNDRSVNPLSAGPRPKEKHVLRNQSDILPSLRELPRHEDASMMIFSHKGLPTKNYYKRRNLNSSIMPIFVDEKDVPPTKERKNKVELTPKISQTVPKLEAEKKTHGNPLSDRNPNVATNPGISRNVLTGSGVNSLDEFKSKSARRKDGNPLLGIGYDEPVIPNTKGRVPPGGFSSGLW